MADDILNWPERVQALPMTLDRFRATCVFFDVKFPPFLIGQLNAKAWVSWGALSALASIPEVFERELTALGLRDKWIGSPERAELRADTLLAILRELRNYETHLEFLSRKHPNDVDVEKVISPVHHRSFFFSPLSFAQISELRNIREGRSLITQAAVDEFNRVAETHTVEGVVDIALDRLSLMISTFLARCNDEDLLREGARK